MSLRDPYLELEIYLEQAKDEISKAFENESPDNHDSNKNLENKTQSDLDPFLLEINATIESDLNELLSRHGKTHLLNNFNDIDNISLNSEEESSTPNILSYEETNGDIIKDSETNLVDFPSVDSLLSSIVAYETNPVDVTTQTSPSLSPSSTNLTWASECSSSPCLTCTSDSDLVEEDLQSTSSIEGVNRQLLFKYKSRWEQSLCIKSSSAPVLKKMPIKVNRQTRSQSDRHLAEIEAVEACKWLRATGFPQYAQMYEDMQFPIDISTVEQDHPLLEPDVLFSLFRRLQILNSCAHLQLQRISHQKTDESEDENCALSDNWTYQSDIRRWSRVCRSQHSGNEEDNKPSDISPQENDDVFEQCTDSPKERLRRAGSTKFRRRKDSLSERGTKLLDSLSQQLSNLKLLEVNHVSDSEVTPKHTQRSRTKSFDITDTWFAPQTTHRDRVEWHKLAHSVELPGEKTVNLGEDGPAISSLACTQLQVLRKLALLKLTAHMEKYCPSHRTGWNWDLSKFIRKMKTPAFKDKIIFGVPLTITLQRTGLPLPRNVEEAMLWLQQNAGDQVGIFRKPGVKSRIQALRNMIETTSEVLNFNDQQSYDVADMVKQYFRELPETLLTNKLSETFLLIFQYVPPYLRRESVLCAILLMPNEHVEVLQSLLNFLLKIAEESATNQMNESNLALCFAPSLFHFSQIPLKQNLGSPHPKELADTRAGHDCLLYILKNFDTIFKIPKEFVNQCKSSEFKECKAVTLNELGRGIGGWKEYLNECQTALLKESRDRSRGWVVIPGHNAKVEITYKNVADGYPLRLWKVSAEVEAPPLEVLNRILRGRHIWDPELHSAKIVSQIDNNCEVFQYVRRNIVPLPNEEYCVVRTWKTDLPKDSCLIIETSIEHQDTIPVPNTVRGIILASRYLIEPCGSGRSKLIHLSRIDIMGKAPEWYQKNYGHICAVFINNIVNSFYHSVTGPESKV